jgi:hypothetical protein
MTKISRGRGKQTRSRTPADSDLLAGGWAWLQAMGDRAATLDVPSASTTSRFDVARAT